MAQEPFNITLRLEPWAAGLSRDEIRERLTDEVYRVLDSPEFRAWTAPASTGVVSTVGDAA